MPLTASTKLGSYEIVAAISPTLSRDALTGILRHHPYWRREGLKNPYRAFTSPQPGGCGLRAPPNRFRLATADQNAPQRIWDPV